MFFDKREEAAIENEARAKYIVPAVGTIPAEGLPKEFDRVLSYGNVKCPTAGPSEMVDVKNNVIFTARVYEDNGSLIGGREITSAWIETNYEPGKRIPMELRKVCTDFTKILADEKEKLQRAQEANPGLYTDQKIAEILATIEGTLTKDRDDKLARLGGKVFPYFAVNADVGKHGEYRVFAQYEGSNEVGLHPIMTDARYAKTQNGSLGFYTDNCLRDTADPKYVAPQLEATSLARPGM